MSSISFTIMQRDEPLMHIHWEELARYATVEHYTDEIDMKFPPTLYAEDNKISAKDLLAYMERRCVPRDRIGIEEILRAHNMRFYDPVAICRVGHGVRWEDYVWLKFDGEEIEWKDVRVRE